MLLESLFLYLIWPVVIFGGYFVSIWALSKFESNLEAELENQG